jgi:hypothetical protein
MTFQPQGTRAHQKPLNIFAGIIPSQKCEWILTATAVIVPPANVRNQVGMYHLEYYTPCLFRIDPGYHGLISPSLRFMIL